MNDVRDMNDPQVLRALAKALGFSAEDVAEVLRHADAKGDLKVERAAEALGAAICKPEDEVILAVTHNLPLLAASYAVLGIFLAMEWPEIAKVFYPYRNDYEQLLDEARGALEDALKEEN